MERNNKGQFKKGNAFNNLIGEKFGMLTVIEKDSTPHNDRKTYWKCKCDCGNEKIIRSDSLLGGKSNSCGCFNVTSHQKHGLHEHKLYYTWEGMKARCYNPNNIKYSIYGKRNITICNKWKNNFLEFYNWAISNGYNEHIKKYGHRNTTIDRINSDGNYEPSNCRWATIKEQNQNRKSRK